MGLRREWRAARAQWHLGRAEQQLHGARRTPAEEETGEVQDRPLSAISALNWITRPFEGDHRVIIIRPLWPLFRSAHRLPCDGMPPQLVEREHLVDPGSHLVDVDRVAHRLEIVDRADCDALQAWLRRTINGNRSSAGGGPASTVGSRAMLHREIKPIAHRCARNQVASFSLWVRATGGQAHGHRHRRALLSRGRRHGLAGLGAATGFLVNPFGSICRVSGGPS